MLKMRFKAVLIVALLLSASAFAVLLKPAQRVADQAESFDLRAAIPTSFGDWSVDESVAPMVVTPDLQKKLDVLYSQLVNRTYVNTAGRRVMLSIAYGGDQRDSLAVHYPDVCYPAQGFQVVSRRTGQIQTAHGVVPVKRMETVLGQRFEPVTYWAMIGDYPTLGRIDKKIAEMRYGLNGLIAGGLLFRVSSIDRTPEQAFLIQERFVSDFLNALAPMARKRISGL